MKIYGETNSGNCLKVKWVCDKLSLPYTWIAIDTLKGETRTPEFQVGEAQNQARLHAALDSLDVMVRAVVFLKLREGMTNEEIAHHLGVTKRMVRRHLVTGYAALRTRLISE